MNAEELREKIGRRQYSPTMEQKEPEHFAFLLWHEGITGGTRVDNYQWQRLQALDDEELMARYARFKLEQGE